MLAAAFLVALAGVFILGVIAGGAHVTNRVGNLLANAINDHDAACKLRGYVASRLGPGPGARGRKGP